MIKPSTSSIVRDILIPNPSQTADEVIRKARLRGVTATDGSIRDTVYNVKSELKKTAAKAATKTAAPNSVPSAARATKTPEPVLATVSEVVIVPASIPSASAPDLSTVFANVALVNSVLGACGGAEVARKTAEAVRACGSVDAFLQHLDLVADIRATDAPG